MISSGIGGGSFSTLAAVPVLVSSRAVPELLAAAADGVFHGTEIILTGFPSTDSVADTVSSWARMGMRSPWSVII